MKRFFKYLGRTILAILGLLLLIVFLLYLPPVQDFLLRKAERYAASHYDLEVRIGLSVWVFLLIWFWTMCMPGKLPEIPWLLQRRSGLG